MTIEQQILREIIEASGLSTQKQISESTGVPEPHISRWIKGVRTPKISTLQEMADSLGLDIDFTVRQK